jgi:hypothetical protein
MKFRQHNLAILRLHTQNGAEENIVVMVLKFQPDPNQASHRKHTLLVTQRLSKTGQFQTYMPHMRGTCEMCRFEIGDT